MAKETRDDIQILLNRFCNRIKVNAEKFLEPLDVRLSVTIERPVVPIEFGCATFLHCPVKVCIGTTDLTKFSINPVVSELKDYDYQHLLSLLEKAIAEYGKFLRRQNNELKSTVKSLLDRML